MSKNNGLPEDYWTPKDIFVHYGKKYGVAATLETFCLGPVETPGVNGAEKACDRSEVVTKPPTRGKLLTQNIQTQNGGAVLLQKNRGGRPKKDGDEPISRMTAWRREREKQGVLV